MTQWKSSIVALAVMAAAAPAHAQPSPPALSYEMTIEGLSEKVTLSLESWSWGVYNDTDTEGITADGKPRKPRGVVVQDLHFVINQVPASALLVDALAGKKVMSKVTVRAKQAGSDKVFEIRLKDATISSFNTGGGGWGTSPMDQISMQFQSAKLTIGPKGKTETADVTKTR